MVFPGPNNPVKGGVPVYQNREVRKSLRLHIARPCCISAVYVRSIFFDQLWLILLKSSSSRTARIYLSLFGIESNKYNGMQPAIKARSKTKLGSRKNRGRGLICARASRAYTNLFVNSERSEHLK